MVKSFAEYDFCFESFDKTSKIFIMKILVKKWGTS